MSSWPTPPDEAAFHGHAGDVVRAIEPHSEADPIALLVQLLVGFGSLIGRTAHFRVEADLHFPNLFAVQVGETSKGRKGTSWSRVRALLAEVDPKWVESCSTDGLSSGEGLINRVRDDIIKYDKNREPYVVPGVEDKRLLVHEAEFSSVLKQAVREGNTLASVIRQAWDTGSLGNMTVEGRRATGAHISINGHITKAELQRQVSETDAANGFGNRFLWYCTRRSKLLPDGGGEIDPQTWDDLRQELRASAEQARRVGEVRRDHDARELWHQVYGELSEGKPGLLGSMIARAEAQVTRLSLIYALLQRQQVIGRVHLEAALKLWCYCEASARCIFGSKLGDPTADAILQALRAVHPDGLTREQISSSVFGRNKPAVEIARALDALEEHGLAATTKEATKGRPAERWYYTNHEVNERNAERPLSSSSSFTSSPVQMQPDDEDLESLASTFPSDWAEQAAPGR